MKRKYCLALTLTMLLPFLMSAATPRYIFMFIGDGMGITPAHAAVNYNRSVLGTTELPLMMTFPYAGQLTTYSANSDVTDSAAAGTALATGHKTNNSMLGMTPDTVAVNSIATILKDRLGYGVGLVTNVAADDATPGAFYAHVPKRYYNDQIDRQFAESQVDFLGGASLKGLYDKDGKSTGALELMQKNGVRYTHSIDSILPTDRRVALMQPSPFNSGNAGYVIDSIPGAISLPDMTQACLDHLMRHTPDGFFMMVEGGNIDHALHANDAYVSITEILNFNNALQVAYDFYQAHPDETLIVVTADHDTGGMSTGNRENGYTAKFKLLKNQKISKEKFSNLCRQWQEENTVPDWEGMKAFLTDNLGFWDTVVLKDKETELIESLYTNMLQGREGADEKTLYNNFTAFSSAVFNTLQSKAAAGFTSGSHTGNPVPIYAIGAGAHLFGRVLDNTQVPKLILDSVLK